MSATSVPKKILARQHEITTNFLKAIDQHLDELMQHKVMDMMEIRDFAEQMHIHPTHLSNTIKLTTGKAPCDFFEEKIMRIAKDMLQNSNVAIAEIATQLTFDPSNFTKFFKRFEGTTPKQYRESVQLYNIQTELIKHI
ncbi:AraC family transcriptional regulator [Mucilaginibacter sabulilitoris]|uniref:AraC family transcriptional regulator n=1 Tax=Mucilaginibacter sabulilitoris TaxID=1173583 RepID=A0ABZ0TM60_9SPHI|nr:AraC family transcriptional regulator [Mucilaginibacter sabulilitoris]WPU92630.1 AraC family transcriptional regulator [Mucilaginibacter sabulilitoris]